MAEFAYQTATIDVEFTNGSTMQITNADIYQDGLVYDRYSTLGNVVTLGTCVASELSLKLENSDRRFDNVPFYGAVLKAQVTMPNSNSTSTADRTITLVNNWFIVNHVSYEIGFVDIVAYDYMTKFDKPFTKLMLKGSGESTVGYSYAIFYCINNIVENCGYDSWDYEESSEPVANMPNLFTAYIRSDDLTVLENKITCRQFFSYLLSICGTCARAYRNTISIFKHKTVAMGYSGYELRNNNRYNSSISKDKIAVTGLYYRATDGTISLVGNTGHVIDYSENPLMSACYTSAVSISPRKTPGAILQEIEDQLSVLSMWYYPFTATVRPLSYALGRPLTFWYEPLVDIDTENVPAAETYETFITHVTQKLNGPTYIAAEGQNEENSDNVPTSGAGTATLSDVFTNLSVAGNASFSGSVAISAGKLLKVIRVEPFKSVSIAANTNKSNTYAITSSDIGEGWAPVCVCGYSMGQPTFNVYRLRLAVDDANTLEYSVRNMDSSAHTGSLGVSILCIRTSL